MSGAGWAVLVPVKRLPAAKTRIALPPPRRAALAVAMALDVVTVATAAAGVRRVVVVTDEAAEPFRAAGALVVGDAPAAGLNPALAHGEHVVRRRGPDVGVAALASDLPALRAEQLAAALAAVPAGRRGLVADVAGTGTTLLAAAPGVPLRPAFGDGSRARHLADGALELTPADPVGLCRDVDTLDDLADAQRLGLGPHTTALLGVLEAPAAS